VLLSVVLWLSLTLQEQRTVSVAFPVEVEGIAEGQALTERPPSTVQVQLQGTGMDLLRIAFNPPTLRVQAGGEKLNVEEAINLPSANDARVESIQPRVVDVQLEPRVERTLPIRSRLAINPASTYELIEPPSLDPDSVTVAGAESVVSSMESWPTDSLTLENVQDTLRREIPLRDTLSGLVERSTDRVTAVVRTGRFAEENREVTVEVTGVPAGQDLITLEPSTITIRYRVLFEQLFESRRSSEFFATVSYSRIRTDTTGYVEPQIHVPSDLVIRDPEPIPPRVRYYTFLSGE
jgi:YbbR domain-containing protein